MRATIFVLVAGFVLVVGAGACSGSSKDDNSNDDAGTCENTSSSGSSSGAVCPDTTSGGPGGGSSGGGSSGGGSSSGEHACLSGYMKSCRDSDEGGCIEAYNVDGPPVLGCNEPPVENQQCDRSTALGGCLRVYGPGTCFLQWAYEEAEPGNIEKGCTATGGIYVPPP